MYLFRLILTEYFVATVKESLYRLHRRITLGGTEESKGFLVKMPLDVMN